MQVATDPEHPTMWLIYRHPYRVGTHTAHDIYRRPYRVGTNTAHDKL